MSESLKKQMLEWLEVCPRDYGEVLEAWRTSCPRLAIWEDAQAEGLAEVAKDGRVRVTEKGRAWLQSMRNPERG